MCTGPLVRVAIPAVADSANDNAAKQYFGNADSTLPDHSQKVDSTSGHLSRTYRLLVHFSVKMRMLRTPVCGALPVSLGQFRQDSLNWRQIAIR